MQTKEAIEKEVSVQEAMMDFFFDEDGLSAVSWGVLVDDQGNII